jgi:hypothetical protein
MGLGRSLHILHENATVAAPGAVITLPFEKANTLVLRILGAFIGAVIFEACIDDSDWLTIRGVAPSDGSVASTATVASVWVFDLTGWSAFRCRITALTGGDITARAWLVPGAAPGGLIVGDVQLEASDIEIGAVEIKNATTDARALVSTAGELRIAGYSVSGTPGRKTVAVPGTPERLVGVSTPCQGVRLTALRGNTGFVAVGLTNSVRAASGTETGSILGPLDSIPVAVADATDIWLDASVAAEGVSYEILAAA